MSAEINPYASPAPIPHDRPPAAPDPLAPLRGPSLGLLLSSGLVAIFGGFNIFVATLDRFANGPVALAPNFEEFLFLAMWLSSIPIYIGAVNMRYGTRYRWAYAAAVLASIPLLTPVFACGLPLGIWALLVLHRQDVKAVFAAKAEQREHLQ